MFKVNNRTRCGICSKLTIKIPERRHWHHSGVFMVNFNRVSIVNFEQVNTDWVVRHFTVNLDPLPKPIFSFRDEVGEFASKLQTFRFRFTLR